MKEELRLKPKRSVRFQVKLSTPELEMLKDKTIERGFTNISQMLRFLALEYNEVIETKIIETNRMVKEILNNLKEKEK